MASKSIVLIHGISSRGPWFERVRDILEPHFACEEIRHYRYRKLGALKVVFGPWIPLGWIAAAYFGDLEGPIWWTVGAVVIIAGGFLEAAGRRWLAVRKARGEIDAVSLNDRPHLIAHSFGTYLAGHALRQSETLSFDRIVLLGCVLPTDFDWHGLLEKDRTFAFRSVRNEIGARDAVVFLAGRVKGLVEGLGDAGLGGFSGDASVVHSLDGPWRICDSCALAPARVHNIELERYGHNFFLEKRHFLDLWLPHLWGFDPRTFREYKVLCKRAARLFEQARGLEEDEVKRKLREKVWPWTEDGRAGRDFEGYVRDVIDRSCRLAKREVFGEEKKDWVRSVVHMVCVDVDRALKEHKKPKVDQREDHMLRLHPKTCVGSAVDRLLRREASGGA